MLADLETVFEPAISWGNIHFIDFFSGDANSTNDVNELDVIFMVNYLKGYGPAPNPIMRGDSNGDCVFNGMDVIYLVNYLKGIGPEPVGANCQ